jgi:hypothetical protein
MRGSREAVELALAELANSETTFKQKYAALQVLAVKPFDPHLLERECKKLLLVLPTEGKPGELRPGVFSLLSKAIKEFSRIQRQRKLQRIADLALDKKQEKEAVNGSSDPS